MRFKLPIQLLVMLQGIYITLLFEIVLSFIIFILLAIQFTLATACGQPKSATLSSVFKLRGVPLDGLHCIDGNFEHGSGVGWLKKNLCSTKKERNPFLVLEFDHPVDVSEVVIYNRPDCCDRRTSKLHVIVTNEYPQVGKMAEGNDESWIVISVFI